MRLFLDANILVSVLNREYPLFPFTARILSLADTPPYKLYTSPVCLAIAFYFAEKKCGATMAKRKTTLLCEHLIIAECSAAGVKKALQNPSIQDLEDGLEYYAALENKCRYIITENREDFYFSEIEVLGSRDFCSRQLH